MGEAHGATGGAARIAVSYGLPVPSCAELAMRALVVVAAWAFAALHADARSLPLDRGTAVERAAALRELARQDPAIATQQAVAWLEPSVEPALRRSAARTLWDLGDKAKPAEPALRIRLDDRDDEVAYAAVGALAAMGTPKADLRAARLRLAHSTDGFIAFYAARAVYPDPDLAPEAALDAGLAAVNLAAAGRPADRATRDRLRTNARAFLAELARTSGRPGFDALVRAVPRTSPPGREAIAEALDDVPAQHGDVAPIAALLDDAAPWVRRRAMGALVDYHERAAPAVDKMLGQLGAQQPKDVREGAAAALAALGAAPALATAQAQPSPWRSDVEARIAPALAHAATTDPERDVRKAAADGLQRLSLWAGPALGAIGDRIAREPDPAVRHALVRACWTARESPQLPRAALAALAEGDPVDYVRNEAKVTLQAGAR
jgi:hypothetical protein